MKRRTRRSDNYSARKFWELALLTALSQGDSPRDATRKANEALDTWAQKFPQDVEPDETEDAPLSPVTRWSQFTDEERGTLLGALQDSCSFRGSTEWYKRCVALQAALAEEPK